MRDVRPIDANTLLELYTPTDDFVDIHAYKVPIPAVVQNILDQPTLDYAPVRHAHIVWKERFRGGFEHNVTIVDDMGISHVGTRDTRHREKTPYCSNCGRELGESSLNFCPNCGAKMEAQGDAL